MTDYTVNGIGIGGTIVSCHGRTFKVAAKGRRYHEDRRDLIYDATPCAAPKAWAASEELRGIIEAIIGAGGTGAGGAIVATWTDQEPGSYARRPYLEMHDSGAIRAVRPMYDDAPLVGWSTDRATARRVEKLMKVAPVGVHLQRAQVKERTVRIDPTNPRFAAACAIPGARPMFAMQAWPRDATSYAAGLASPLARVLFDGGPVEFLRAGDPVVVPITAWRAAQVGGAA